MYPLHLLSPGVQPRGLCPWTLATHKRFCPLLFDLSFCHAIPSHSTHYNFGFQVSVVRCILFAGNHFGLNQLFFKKRGYLGLTPAP